MRGSGSQNGHEVRGEQSPRRERGWIGPHDHAELAVLGTTVEPSDIASPPEGGAGGHGLEPRRRHPVMVAVSILLILVLVLPVVIQIFARLGI
ncbi:MAG TPA: hypothetical protein VKX16_05420 [Chloroflexota bacterium]|nr:hypothetical protein [Chloroflexota bacterium]